MDVSSRRPRAASWGWALGSHLRAGGSTKMNDSSDYPCYGYVSAIHIVFRRCLGRLAADDGVHPGDGQRAQAGTTTGPFLFALWRTCPARRGRRMGRGGSGSQGSRVTPPVETFAEISPAVLADAAQVACGGRTQPRRGGRDQPHLAAQHRRGRGRLRPSRGARGAVASRTAARGRCWCAAGPGRRSSGIARPVAAGDLAEVLDRAAKSPAPARWRAMAPTRPSKRRRTTAAVSLAALPGRAPPGAPSRRLLDVLARGRRCARGRGRSAAAVARAAASRPFPHPVQATGNGFEPGLSFSPEAASGARPSSVMALRTAAQ